MANQLNLGEFLSISSKASKRTEQVEEHFDGNSDDEGGIPSMKKQRDV